VRPRALIQWRPEKRIQKEKERETFNQKGSRRVGDPGGLSVKSRECEIEFGDEERERERERDRFEKTKQEQISSRPFGRRDSLFAVSTG